MHPAREDSGFTLFELLTTLLLIGVAVGLAGPPAKRLQDRVAVDAAAGEVVALLHRTRRTAVEAGGAVLHLRADSARLELRVGEGVVAVASVGESYGVTLTLSRDRAEVDLHFDALGLGRVASQTVRLRRGAAERALVVSSLGRVVAR